jgi:phosphoribosyl-AMP cyclohydrolase/phosphoribosyl-ATP pyrophosphohydrolase/phosphoribosyl-AMP cyclohydrolase
MQDATTKNTSGAEGVTGGVAGASDTFGIPELAYNKDGLIPCIVQSHKTGKVLMMAWMNAETLRLTCECGETVFWSRSRQEVWHKGATSGNVQRVRELLYDCDADTLLAIVDEAGPACHTGSQTCFYRSIPLR